MDAGHPNVKHLSGRPEQPYGIAYARQTVGEGESATLVRGVDRFGHFRAEPKCERDFAPEAVAFQEEVQRLKRAVYDSA
jgi:hypothetical protein